MRTTCIVAAVQCKRATRSCNLRSQSFLARRSGTRRSSRSVKSSQGRWAQRWHMRYTVSNGALNSRAGIVRP